MENPVGKLLIYDLGKPGGTIVGLIIGHDGYGTLLYRSFRFGGISHSFSNFIIRETPFAVIK